MSVQDPSLVACLDRLSAGDQEAAREIYERFVDRLVQQASRRLNRKLGAMADPESVAQSVFESFFVRHQRGEFQLHNWAMVFGLLSHITFRKCLNRNRKLGAARRGGSDVVESFDDWKSVDVDPGPDQVAEVTELLEKVLSRFDPDERTILNAFLDGASTDAVAKQVQLSTRTVQRTVERFRNDLLTQIESE